MIMGTTYALQLPYPELADAANVPVDMKELADAIEATQSLAVMPAVTALATAYPAGASVGYVPGADGPNWPTGVQSVVVTAKTSNNVAAQFCSPSSSSQSRLWYRPGLSSAWGPWVKLSDDRSAGVIARGRVSVTASAAISGTAAVTFPAGLFTTGPRVVASAVGSSVYVAYMPGAATSSGVTIGIRHMDATATTATISVDWIAVESE
jgi:hypothetical protein